MQWTENFLALILALWYCVSEIGKTLHYRLNFWCNLGACFICKSHRLLVTLQFNRPACITTRSLFLGFFFTYCWNMIWLDLFFFSSNDIPLPAMWKNMQLQWNDRIPSSSQKLCICAVLSSGNNDLKPRFFHPIKVSFPDRVTIASTLMASCLQLAG